jgi:hypothetical protein
MELAKKRGVIKCFRLERQKSSFVRLGRLSDFQVRPHFQVRLHKH